MCVDLGCFDVGVTEQILKCADVDSRFQHVRGKTVPPMPSSA